MKYCNCIRWLLKIILIVYTLDNGFIVVAQVGSWKTSIYYFLYISLLTLSLIVPTFDAFANRSDPDQPAPAGAV